MICPYCRTENQPGATRCAACTSWMSRPPPAREWTRPRDGRWIAGVSRGLADRFAVSPAVVRVAFILATVFGGWGVVVYLALWVVMPQEPLALPPSSQTVVQSSGPGPQPPA